ncbi:peptidase M16 [Erythrobacter sp. KY5]|uniref:M16 family metallopeptidase n=1 Tax=Erythrobacter sp. KY5 TaxID=2011159 RepID=UPI000DBF10F7|nr:M16 family metallopeptidase [Erythrobacter sp. KY5]AWW74161.1 peptidase M16 [Erythrobacter sp. KY5]
MNFPTRAFAAGLLLALPNIALTSTLAAQDAAPSVEYSGEPTWYFEQSDIPVDPGYTFGVLENGMRYILRENATPEGTAMVRMRIDSGSLAENEAERGLSHYLEHMAFNGSKGIPEGEMIALLEREGLAFGADTNASTGFDAITYMLNLPRNDEDLLGTALMLMRETASELTIAEDAVERERGVVLSERRDRRNFAQKAREDGLEFVAPGARFIERLPIGTLEALENASAAQLRSLYERTYTPSNTVLVIVGDFPVEVMEAAIRERFSDWAPAPAPVEPEAGPVDITRRGETDIYIDPALSESVTITALGPWIDRPDTLATRRENLLRSIGMNIIARRLSRLTRQEDAPFSGARFSMGEIFEDARTNSITISTENGQWRDGLLAAVREVNQALAYGFTQAEVDEQVANGRTAIENQVAGAETRANGFFVGSALRLVADDVVPTLPEDALVRFNQTVEGITPEDVFALLKADLLPIDDPLIRFQGRTAPEGGEAALRAAFVEAMALPIAAPADTGSAQFAYTDFGEPGTIVSDTRDDRFGFRYVTFDNGVRLTIKQTDIREDRVSFRVLLDGGSLLNTREDPLATYLVTSLPLGGLGQHSRDELQTILAGRSVRLNVAAGSDTFSFAGGTTPRDLELQLQLVAAGITDPGYRPEGIDQFRRNIDNFFDAMGSTPASAYGEVSGKILSDGDPRFSLQSREAFFAKDYDQLANVISDRFENGAIEVALVGDIDEDAAIASVASTLGALPPREIDFQPREAARTRTFTEDRGEKVVRHSGEEDQAWVRMIWPTRDDSDHTETIELQLLARAMRIALTDRLREDLGQAYSTQATSFTSNVYPGYGTFTLFAPVGASELETVRGVFRELLSDFREGRIDPDLIERARKPMLEAYDNALKSLGGWMNLADRAQSQADRLGRWFESPELLKAVTAEDLQTAAAQYLSPEDAVEFLVLPKVTGITRPPVDLSTMRQAPPARVIQR